MADATLIVTTVATGETLDVSSVTYPDAPTTRLRERFIVTGDTDRAEIAVVVNAEPAVGTTAYGLGVRVHGRTPVHGVAAEAAAVSGNPLRIGGWDGTNLYTIRTDTSGRPVVVGGAAVGAAPAGNPLYLGTVIPTTGNIGELRIPTANYNASGSPNYQTSFIGIAMPGVGGPAAVSSTNPLYVQGGELVGTPFGSFGVFVPAFRDSSSDAVTAWTTENLDYDTGGGTANVTVFGIALPASGGPVAGGTAANPIGTRLSDGSAFYNAAQSLADDSAFTVGTTQIVPVGGTYRSVRDTVDDNDAGAFAMTQSRALLMSIETPNADSAMDDTNDAVRVNIVAGSAAPSKTDDSAFTIATDTVSPLGALFDETSPDLVDEGDVGLVRMSQNRVLYNTIRDALGAERGAQVTLMNQLGVRDETMLCVLSELKRHTSLLRHLIGAVQDDIPGDSEVDAYVVDSL